MKVFVCGSEGRMSSSIRALLDIHPELQLESTPENSQVVIDFTAPQAFDTNLSLALQHGSAFLCGTTGLSQRQHESLKEAAQKIAVLWASNTSLGANLLIELTRIASKLLPRFPISIQDTHHRHKKDAPSGTALSLQTAAARPCNISSSREGEVVGVHEVIFQSAFERVSLKHEALDRKVFAEGALSAAAFLGGQKPGLYSIQDVLGFSP
ncbi:MAG: 4-hydroxy-tetrahydrodipicolinate reductase [Deltaproteobacteria bacterium]|nr:4-hydroxy-tetrahydrodipicolinate reductase [Deltaproteobacteria bacterium]